mmetsp:Transcript_62994/g.148410  ORF Transcript_62994/g.148410 Transcript_62994/m.148410 type:complete len:239 (-) Transcript_62994:9-725(-)
MSADMKVASASEESPPPSTAYPLPVSTKPLIVLPLPPGPNTAYPFPVSANPSPLGPAPPASCATVLSCPSAPTNDLTSASWSGDKSEENVQDDPSPLTPAPALFKETKATPSPSCDASSVSPPAVAAAGSAVVPMNWCRSGAIVMRRKSLNSILSLAEPEVEMPTCRPHLNEGSLPTTRKQWPMSNTAATPSSSAPPTSKRNTSSTFLEPDLLLNSWDETISCTPRLHLERVSSELQK